MIFPTNPLDEMDRIVDMSQDHLILGCIPTEFREYEREVRTKRWFDYRFLSALEATAIFAESYRKEMRRMFAEEIDYERAKHIRWPDFPKMVRVITGKEKGSVQGAKTKVSAFWRARLVADLMTMPYPEFIREVAKSRMRYWKQGHLPTPTQIYSDRDVEAVAKWWEEVQASIFYYSEHPAYLNQNYMGTHDQNDHHEWLMAQAKLRPNQEEILAELISQDLLFEDKVRARLTGEENERLDCFLS